MKTVESAKPRGHLPSANNHLDPPGRDASVGHTTQKGSGRGQGFATCRLVCPKLRQLGHQGIRQENIPDAAAFRDFTAHKDTPAYVTRWEEHVPDIELGQLTQPQTGAERQADDDVIPRMLGGNIEQCTLLIRRQARGT